MFPILFAEGYLCAIVLDSLSSFSHLCFFPLQVKSIIFHSVKEAVAALLWHVAVALHVLAHPEMHVSSRTIACLAFIFLCVCIHTQPFMKSYYCKCHVSNPNTFVTRKGISVLCALVDVRGIPMSTRILFISWSMLSQCPHAYFSYRRCYPNVCTLFQLLAVCVRTEHCAHCHYSLQNKRAECWSSSFTSFLVCFGLGKETFLGKVEPFFEVWWCTDWAWWMTGDHF